MYDGVPITGFYLGEPVPNLALLPRERWRPELRRVSHRTRQLAMASARTQSDFRAAMQVVGDLSIEPGVAPAPGVGATPPEPLPAGDPPPRGSSRQINFRLGPNEHARLVQAARLYGMRPTVLARVLTVRGVDRALYEERRGR